MLECKVHPHSSQTDSRLDTRLQYLASGRKCITSSRFKKEEEETMVLSLKDLISRIGKRFDLTDDAQGQRATDFIAVVTTSMELTCTLVTFSSYIYFLGYLEAGFGFCVC